MNEPKTISKLLRAIAGGAEAQKNRHDVILIAAAEMIDAFDREKAHLVDADEAQCR